MELYLNSTWTARYGDAYVAEAFAWSEGGNHATGSTADEADAKPMGALHERAARRPLRAAMILWHTGPDCPHRKQRTLHPPPRTRTSFG